MGSSTRLKRSSLIGLTVAGAVVSLIGGTGLFAALTDTAESGDNSASSRGLTGTIDLQLAPATWDESSSTVTCGEFSENLTSGLFTLTDVDYATLEEERGYYCLRNAGSGPAKLAEDATGVVDTDSACTGDEELNGDDSCGSGLEGELSRVVVAYHELVSCEGATLREETRHRDVYTEANSLPEDSETVLAPNETACAIYIVDAANDPQGWQQAQSDELVWRFRWHASQGGLVLPPPPPEG